MLNPLSSLLLSIFGSSVHIIADDSIPAIRSHTGSAKNAASAWNICGRISVEMKNTNFLSRDSGSENLTCPRAVIISTLVYWNDSGMIMHSNAIMYFAARPCISALGVKNDAKSLEPMSVSTNMMTVYVVAMI